MNKVDIIRKHVGSSDFYDLNGTTMLSNILEAMEEYAEIVKNHGVSHHISDNWSGNEFSPFVLPSYCKHRGGCSDRVCEDITLVCRHDRRNE